jgi:hypothetical protein
MRALLPSDGGFHDRKRVVVDYLKALECIGCRWLEEPQPCIGVCQDRIVELVYASSYKEALMRAELAQQ